MLIQTKVLGIWATLATLTMDHVSSVLTSVVVPETHPRFVLMHFFVAMVTAHVKRLVWQACFIGNIYGRSLQLQSGARSDFI